jgi:hypothetical protein
MGPEIEEAKRGSLKKGLQGLVGAVIVAVAVALTTEGVKQGCNSSSAPPKRLADDPAGNYNGEWCLTGTEADGHLVLLGCFTSDAKCTDTLQAFGRVFKSDSTHELRCQRIAAERPLWCKTEVVVRDPSYRIPTGPGTGCYLDPESCQKGGYVCEQTTKGGFNR